MSTRIHSVDCFLFEYKVGYRLDYGRKVSIIACAEAVLKFLQDHNRPFSNNDIQSGVEGDFGKSAILKYLDVLVRQEKVKEKVYGKQKVYCIVQKHDASGNKLREQLLEMDRQVNDLTLRMNEINEKLKSKTQLVKHMKGKMSLTEAVHKNVELDGELESIKQKLSNYSGTQSISPTKKLEVEKEFEKYSAHYKKRKRMCTDMLDSILENYPKTKKHLFEDIGLETDEDVGFSVDKL